MIKLLFKSYKIVFSTFLGIFARYLSQFYAYNGRENFWTELIRSVSAATINRFIVCKFISRKKPFIAKKSSHIYKIYHNYIETNSSPVIKSYKIRADREKCYWPEFNISSSSNYWNSFLIVTYFLWETSLSHRNLNVCKNLTPRKTCKPTEERRRNVPFGRIWGT